MTIYNSFSIKQKELEIKLLKYNNHLTFYKNLKHITRKRKRL